MNFKNHEVWKLQIIWGKQKGILFIPSGQNLFIVRDDIIILSMSANTSDKDKNNFLKLSLKKLLRSEIEILMPKWERITGFKCTSWFIGKNSSAWGWCRPSDCRIMLNEHLIYKPKECLEYVILHELCHLNQANHGQGFEQLLSKYMPNWRDFEVLNNGVVPTYG